MDSNSAVESEEQERRNWLELPPELWSMILHKIGAIEILTSAQNVCSSWRKICKNPIMWRVIDTGDRCIAVYNNRDPEPLWRQAVDLSCGQLVDINIVHFGTDEFLQCITRSSNQLRRLGIVNCKRISDKGLSKAISKVPWLEYLELISCSFDVETLKTIGRCCPLLKSLKLNKKVWWGQGPRLERDEEALAIAETMPKLQHLEIIGNVITNQGLQAILGGCTYLESLNLRHCLNLDLDGPLGLECARRMKNVIKGSEYYTRSDRNEFTTDLNALRLFCIPTTSLRL